MSIMRSATILALAMAFITAVASISRSQDEVAPQPLTPSDTSSFRATLHSFIDACNEVYDLAESTDAATDLKVRLLPALDRIRDCLDLGAVDRRSSGFTWGLSRP